MSESDYIPYPRQSPAEFEPLIMEIRRLQPKRILEVGAFRGGATVRFAEAAMPGVEAVVAVDMPGAAWGYDDSEGTLWDAVECLRKRGVSTCHLNADSQAAETVERISQLAPFDFIFLDADHTYEGVKRDFENYFPMLAPGGILGLHDIAGEGGKSRIHDGKNVGGHAGKEIAVEVPKFWEEIKGKYRTAEWIDKEATMGVGVIFK